MFWIFTLSFEMKSKETNKMQPGVLESVQSFHITLSNAAERQLISVCAFYSAMHMQYMNTFPQSTRRWFHKDTVDCDVVLSKLPL